MPIYEYACRACGHAFEALVQSSTVPECPTCHSQDLEKQLSVFAVATGGAREHAPSPAACHSCDAQGSPGGCPYSSQ